MTQDERLDYLLDAFKKDSKEFQNLVTGPEYKERRMVLRSLMNIRMPGAMDEEVLEVQDAFLMEEAREKGIVHLDDIPTLYEAYGSSRPYAGHLSIWKGDITTLGVDAIVNAANSQMLGCFIPCHRCIDNAIHSAAGIQLREACSQKMYQKRIRYGNDYEAPTGQAMVTKGYNLPAKYVIHTVGPIVGGRLTEGLKQALRNCYISVLNSCLEHKIRSVAFCCISTGEFHFPNDQAAKIATDSVKQFLNGRLNEFDRIIFNVFKDIDKELYEECLLDPAV